jgi:lipoprotein NlpD
MGQTDKEQVMLHFEIRKKGLSVNPMDYFKTKS